PRAPGLRQNVAGRGQRVGAPTQAVRIVVPGAEPAGVVAFHLIGVLDRQIDLLETVIGTVDGPRRIGAPPLRHLLVVAPLGRPAGSPRRAAPADAGDAAAADRGPGADGPTCSADATCRPSRSDSRRGA